MKKQFCLILFVCISLLSFSQRKLGLTEYVTNTTVGIQTNGKSVLSGTGFYFVFQTEKGLVPCLITSKHLFTDAQTVTFFLLEENEKNFPQYGKTQEITIKKTDLAIINHPDNDVDLALIPVASIVTYFAEKKITISYHPINEAVIPTDSIVRRLNPVESIYLIGSPAGIRKELSGIAMVRKGVTATPMFLDYNKKKEFLIDLPSYEGSSGAPVFVYQINNSDRFDERMEGQRLLLAGINSATYAKGFRERFYPDDQRNLPQENISIVIKAERILDFKKVLKNYNR